MCSYTMPRRAPAPAAASVGTAERQCCPKIARATQKRATGGDNQHDDRQVDQMRMQIGVEEAPERELVDGEWDDAAAPPIIEGGRNLPRKRRLKLADRAGSRPSRLPTTASAKPAHQPAHQRPVIPATTEYAAEQVRPKSSGIARLKAVVGTMPVSLMSTAIRYWP